MALLDLYTNIEKGLKDGLSGVSLLRRWFLAARKDFATRSESLEELLPAPVQEALVEHLQQTILHFANMLQTAERGLPAVWLGLFEQSVHGSEGYVLVTYAGLSNIGTEQDREWMCRTTPDPRSYFELLVLTEAHRKPAGCSQDTANAIYVLLPVAFLAGVAGEIAKMEHSETTAEYALGWDSGDFITWRPERTGARAE